MHGQTKGKRDLSVELKGNYVARNIETVAETFAIRIQQELKAIL